MELKQEEIDELNRIQRLIDERKEYQAAVNKKKDELHREVLAGSRVNMYALSCHTIAREWGEHFFDVEKISFTFDDALEQLTAIRMGRGAKIKCDRKEESATWEHIDYDGHEYYKIERVALEMREK